MAFHRHHVHNIYTVYLSVPCSKRYIYNVSTTSNQLHIFVSSSRFSSKGSVIVHFIRGHAKHIVQGGTSGLEEMILVTINTPSVPASTMGSHYASGDDGEVELDDADRKLMSMVDEFGTLLRCYATRFVARALILSSTTSECNKTHSWHFALGNSILERTKPIRNEFQTIWVWLFGSRLAKDFFWIGHGEISDYYFRKVLNDIEWLHI